MNRRIWTVSAALAVLASAAIAGMAADNVSSAAPANTVEANKAQAHEATRADPAQKSCLNQCNTAETKCSTEVRRARAQCSRNAANGGRDPYTGRNDYAYFCSYFDNPSRNCGASTYGGNCQARFNHRYGLCVDTMYDNIAAMRHDCYKNERDAQNFCREELRDCKSTCK